MNTPQRILRNSTLNLIAGISQRIGQTVTFIYIARLLTVSHTGSFKLANTYTSILLTLSLWGLDQILIRDVSHKSQSLRQYLSNFLLLRLLLSSLIWASLWLFIPLLPYETTTQQLVLVMTAMIIPSSINNLYQSVWVVLEDMRKFSMITLFYSIMRLLGGVGLLFGGQPILAIGFLFLIISVMEMISNIIVAHRQPVLKPWVWQVDLNFWRTNLTIALPFIAISFILVVEYQFDDVILSFFWPESEVGIYATAATILSLLLFLTRSIQLAIFPVISQAYHQSVTQLQKVYSQSMSFLLLLSLPITIIISLASTQLIVLIFGEPYRSAGGILSVLVWAFFISAFNVANSRVLIVAGKEKQMSRFAMLSMLGNLLLSFLLVPRYGGVGTAWARVLAMPLYSIPALLYVQWYICPLNWHEMRHLDWRRFLKRG